MKLRSPESGLYPFLRHKLEDLNLILLQVRSRSSNPGNHAGIILPFQNEPPEMKEIKKGS